MQSVQTTIFGLKYIYIVWPSCDNICLSVCMPLLTMGSFALQTVCPYTAYIYAWIKWKFTGALSQACLRYSRMHTKTTTTTTMKMKQNSTGLKQQMKKKWTDCVKCDRTERVWTRGRAWQSIGANERDRQRERMMERVKRKLRQMLSGVHRDRIIKYNIFQFSKCEKKRREEELEFLWPSEKRSNENERDERRSMLPWHLVECSCIARHVYCVCICRYIYRIGYRRCDAVIRHGVCILWRE